MKTRVMPLFSLALIDENVAWMGDLAIGIVHYGKRRVRRHLIVESEGEARFGQAMDRMVGDAERHEIRIGYHERFGHAHLDEDDGQLVERMLAADDAGGTVEFKSVHEGSP